MIDVVYTCPFVPAEWITAHGLRACRIVPRPNCRPSGVPTTGVCAYARSFAEHVLDLDSDTAVVFTSRCDQMRRLYDLVAAQRNGPTFLLNVPATWRTPGGGCLPTAERLYAHELQRLSRFLQQAGGSALDRERLAAEIVRTRSNPGTPNISVRERTKQPDGEDAYVRLGVSGGPLPPESSFFEQVAAAGASVVLDATDSGERLVPWQDYVPQPQAVLQDPAGELARAYLAMPSIHQRPNNRVFAWLHHRIMARQVQGLVLHRYTWCDLWHAEVPRITELVGVPVLDLAVDAEEDALTAGDPVATQNRPAPRGQASTRNATRIGAFVEMIEQIRTVRHGQGVGS